MRILAQHSKYISVCGVLLAIKIKILDILVSNSNSQITKISQQRLRMFFCGIFYSFQHNFIKKT